MVDACIIIYVLVLVGNSHTAKVYFSTFACQQHFGCIAGSTVMQGHAIQQDITVRFLFYVQVADTDCTGMCFFQFVHIEYGILSGKDFNDLRCKEIHVIHGMVTNQQAGLCAIFQDNQHTPVHHKVDVCTQDVYQLDRLFHNYIFRYIEDDAVLCKSGIESRHAIFGSIRQFAVILLHQFRMLSGYVFQTTEDNAFRQMAFGKCLVIKCIIDYEIQSSAHIRHIALKHFIRVDRDSETVQVQPEVRFKVFAYIRIFVLLHLTGRESDSLKIGKGSGTGCIQHFGTMLADHGFRL